MDWKNYRKRYSVFLASLQQTEMIYFHAAKAIPDTPTKIKEEDKEETPFLVNLSRQSFRQVSDEWRTDHMLLDIEPIVQLVFDGKKERILAYHELAMLIAHLEAFVTDTLKTVWLLDPSILETTTPTGKKALKDFGTSALSSLSSEQLERISDDAIWDLMRKSTDAYMNYLVKTLSLSISTNYGLLYRANLDRHAIVHNGGVITQDKYIGKLNEKERQGLVAGEPIPINSEYISRIYNLVQTLGEGIFTEVSRRYFGVPGPLKEYEQIVDRESPTKKRLSPKLESAARQAITNSGGPGKVVSNYQEVKDEMIRLINEDDL